MSSTCDHKTNSKFDQDTNLHLNTNKCIDNYAQLYEIQARKKIWIIGGLNQEIKLPVMSQ